MKYGVLVFCDKVKKKRKNEQGSHAAVECEKLVASWRNILHDLIIFRYFKMNDRHVGIPKCSPQYIDDNTVITDIILI